MVNSRSRKNRSRRNRRNLNGGMSPVNWNSASLMPVSLAQGKQFESLHAGQHGGMAPYPGGVVSSSLPAELNDSARISPTLNAYKQIQGLQDGGRKKRNSRKNRKSRNSRKGRKGRKSRNSRKNRRNSRKNRRQNGGDFVRWGGGGYNSDVDAPLPYGDVSKMLIPPSLQQQAGLHREWTDAENPMAFAPK
jgi:hypothetical protein